MSHDARLPKGRTDPENPDRSQLAAYGALAFLYLRSERHRGVSLSAARLAIQPAIDLRFNHILEVDGVPRAAVTWAFLGPEAEAKLKAGQRLMPKDWVSGEQMWLLDIIAPYGQGTAAHVVRWLRHNVPSTVETLKYMRIGRDNRPSKIVQIRRLTGNTCGVTLIAGSKRNDVKGV